MKFEKMVFRNEDSEVPENLKITREKFDVIKVTFEEEDKDIIEKLIQKANVLALNCNSGAANTSLPRTPDKKFKNAFSGVIAEEVCIKFLNNTKPGIASYTNYEGSINQIDIKLSNEKTIEVRSSCIRNGVDFGLFCKSKYNPNQQYLDVLGPYSNGYKSNEIDKNYYMRVIYHCDIEDFVTHFNSESFAAYIVGGATWEMMGDDNLFQIKNLIPEGSDAETKSKYRVIPIGKALDVSEIINKIIK